MAHLAKKAHLKDGEPKRKSQRRGYVASSTKKDVEQAVPSATTRNKQSTASDTFSPSRYHLGMDEGNPALQHGEMARIHRILKELHS